MICNYLMAVVNLDAFFFSFLFAHLPFCSPFWGKCLFPVNQISPLFIFIFTIGSLIYFISSARHNTIKDSDVWAPCYWSRNSTRVYCLKKILSIFYFRLPPICQKKRNSNWMNPGDPDRAWSVVWIMKGPIKRKVFSLHFDEVSGWKGSALWWQGLLIWPSPLLSKRSRTLIILW